VHNDENPGITGIFFSLFGDLMILGYNDRIDYLTQIADQLDRSRFNQAALLIAVVGFLGNGWS
jgi:hypothetical protein